MAIRLISQIPWILFLASAAAIAESDDDRRHSPSSPLHPQVEAVIKDHRGKVEDVKRRIAALPGDLQSVPHVKQLLSLLVEIDQKTRKLMDRAGDFEEEAFQQFWRELLLLMEEVDLYCRQNLKAILGEHHWVTIKVFGAEADNHAWLIAQHADNDLAFQKKVLAILEDLYPTGDTSPTHYAKSTGGATRPTADRSSSRNCRIFCTMEA